MEKVILKKKVLVQPELAKVRITTGIRLACMFLFLYTAYAKLIDHERFVKGLTKVRLISAFAVYISWLVPLVEILVFILLLIPKTVKPGFYAFTCLMILFTLYIISALLWEQNLPCHCGGVIENLSWGQHIWFNLAFILLALFALRLMNSKRLLKK